MSVCEEKSVKKSQKSLCQSHNNIVLKEPSHISFFTDSLLVVVMSMTKEILQTACRNLLRRNVTISSKDTSFGRCHKIEFAICKHTFEWKIDQHMEGKTTDAILNDSFDVMPILPTFSDIDYDPYSACYHVQLLLSAPSLSDTAAQGTSHNTTIDDIVVVLIESLVNDQRQKVKLLTKSFRLDIYVHVATPAVIVLCSTLLLITHACC